MPCWACVKVVVRSGRRERRERTLESESLDRKTWLSTPEFQDVSHQKFSHQLVFWVCSRRPRRQEGRSDFLGLDNDFVDQDFLIFSTQTHNVEYDWHDALVRNGMTVANFDIHVGARKSMTIPGVKGVSVLLLCWETADSNSSLQRVHDLIKMLGPLCLLFTRRASSKYRSRYAIRSGNVSKSSTRTRIPHCTSSIKQR